MNAPKSSKPSPFAARSNVQSPAVAPPSAQPSSDRPVPAQGGRIAKSGGARLWAAAVSAVAAGGIWFFLGNERIEPTNPAAAVQSSVTKPAQPDAIGPVRLPDDFREDYAELSRVASTVQLVAEERAAMATAALRAADGAFAEAVRGVGPVALKAIEAVYAREASDLEEIKLEDHDVPGVRELRRMLAEAKEAAKDGRWAAAVAARQAAIAVLPKARMEIAERLSLAGSGAVARGDKSLALFFYQQALRLEPARSEARDYLYANRYSAGQGLRTRSGIEVAYAPPGVFIRGSRFSEPGRDMDEAPSEIRFPFGVFVSVTEVTQRQWDQVFGAGAAARIIAQSAAGSRAVGPELPMHSIRWAEAVEFCRRLSLKDGVAYRLPTEAEWEYACRAGTDSAFNTGADFLSITDAVIDDGSSDAPTMPSPAGSVGKPNAWNLRDMHGNVWEWCSDWSAPYPPGGAVAPAGPDDAAMGRADLAMKTVRGGGWNTSARDARSANRWEYPPDAATGYIGFRFVMLPDLAAP